MGEGPCCRRLARLVSLAVVLLAAPARSHPLFPSLLELRELDRGRVLVRWKTPARRVPGSHLEPLAPAGCARASEPITTRTATAVVERWEMACGSGGLVGRRVEVAGIAGSKTDVVLRVRLADGRSLLGLLRAESPVFVVPARAAPLGVLRSYVRLGVEHILAGFDHLLFVLGLVLLAADRRQLLWTVTAFTGGHSVTLSLAVLGFVQVSQGPIEALIALTILVLAVELAREENPRGTVIRRYPWAMSFSFGLLHGLGFAGALAGVGLPSGAIPLALFAFNAGIELGQLAFIVAAVVARAGLALVAAGGRWRLAWLAPYTIGSLAAYWFFARLAASL